MTSSTVDPAAAAGPTPERPGAPVERAMVTAPKTLPPTVTVAEAVAAFTDHVHMLLVVDADDRLLATLCRDDLEGALRSHPASAALPHGRLEDRTVRSGTSLAAARSRLETLGVRRVAVVGDDDRLLGLLCLKRHRGGYCSDAGVQARADAR